MDRRGVMLGLALAAMPALARADAKPVKLAKVFPFLDKYLALPPAERNRFTLTYSLQIDGKPASGLRAAIVEPDGRRMPLSFGPDGRATRLPSAAQLASASFAADVPAAAKMGVHMTLEPLIALSQELAARDLELAIAQANAGIAKAGGLIALALPRLTGVSFPGAGSGRARLVNGADVSLPLAEGAPFYDPKALKGAATILLAHLPARLAFRDK